MERITFDEARERAEQRGDEWQVGSVEQDIALIPLVDRVKYLPDGVLQFNSKMDSNGCASRAPVNLLKAKFTYLYHTDMHPTLKAWMQEKGYVKDNKVVFDETFIEILSGSTPQGNSLKAPVNAIYKHGLIPECLPMGEMTWDEYMNPARITEEMKELGRQFLARFKINYEQVQAPHFRSELQIDYIDCALHAWPQPVNGVYKKNDGNFNHAVALANPFIDAFDNYEPFIKRLAPDYVFFDWGYTFSVVSQTPDPSPNPTTDFEAWKAWAIAALLAALAWLKTKETIPPTIPQKPLPPETMQAMVLRVCKEKGLSERDTKDLYATISCESNFKPLARNDNKVNGKTVSTDWGICQINDYYHIGPGKSFPSVDYVLDNPEACVRWMCDQWKRGAKGKNLWICYRDKYYLKHL